MEQTMTPSPQIHAIDAQEFETGLDRVRQLYTFSDTDVEPFLRGHPELVPFLLEAVPQVERFFGLHTVVSLCMVIDPEYDIPPDLVAYIRTSLPVSEGLDRLAQFDEDWYLHQLDRITPLFNFNLEFA
jgi:hypothetical protein